MRRRTVVIAVLAAGAAVLAASGQTWVEATGLAGSRASTAAASGTDASPVGTALALVAMAGALALTTVRRLGAVLVGVLTALAGIVVVGTAVTAALDPVGTAASAVSAVTGTTARAQAYTVTAWPWVTAAAGLAIAGLGVVAAVSGRGWEGTRRFESGPGVPDAGSGHATTASTGPELGPARTARAARAERRLDEMDAWDELSRGNDPT